jgi:outer membrane protein TolC
VPTGERRGWRATVDLTWALYDGGARYGKRHQAEAQLAGARAAAQAQRLAVLEELEDASRDLEVSAERLRLAEKQRAVAADAAAIARRGFEAGVTGNADVLEANDQLFQAELLLADARARLGAAVAAHDRAAGRL